MFNNIETYKLIHRSMLALKKCKNIFQLILVQLLLLEAKKVQSESTCRNKCHRETTN